MIWLIVIATTLVGVLFASGRPVMALAAGAAILGGFFMLRAARIGRQRQNQEDPSSHEMVEPEPGQEPVR